MTEWISRTPKFLTGFGEPPIASSSFATWHTWPAASTPPPSTSSGNVRKPLSNLSIPIQTVSNQTQSLQISVNYCFCLFPIWNQDNINLQGSFFTSKISNSLLLEVYGKKKTWKYEEEKQIAVATKFGRILGKKLYMYHQNLVKNLV